jgi:hypothetical protein
LQGAFVGAGLQTGHAQPFAVAQRTRKSPPRRSGENRRRKEISSLAFIAAARGTRQNAEAQVELAV